MSNTEIKIQEAMGRIRSHVRSQSFQRLMKDGLTNEGPPNFDDIRKPWQDSMKKGGYPYRIVDHATSASAS